MLDIAKTVCLQSLRLNENAFRQYLTMALQEMEFPESVPVEIKACGYGGLVSFDELAELLSDQPVSLSVDASLSDGTSRSNTTMSR